MTYVFDSTCFRILGNFYPGRFPAVWTNLDGMVAEGRLLSVREAFKELDHSGTKEYVRKWIKLNKTIFVLPTEEETLFVSEIFKVPHFQYMVGHKQLLVGTPVADPFLVACAKVRRACLVTDEASKPNSARIPIVCSHFKVDCITLEEFMEQEGWEF